MKEIRWFGENFPSARTQTTDGLSAFRSESEWIGQSQLTGSARTMIGAILVCWHMHLISIYHWSSFGPIRKWRRICWTENIQMKEKNFSSNKKRIFEEESEFFSKNIKDRSVMHWPMEKRTEQCSVRSINHIDRIELVPFFKIQSNEDEHRHRTSLPSKRDQCKRSLRLASTDVYPCFSIGLTRVLNIRISPILRQALLALPIYRIKCIERLLNVVSNSHWWLLVRMSIKFLLSSRSDESSRWKWSGKSNFGQ